MTPTPRTVCDHKWIGNICTRCGVAYHIETELRIAQLERELEEAKRESEDRNQQWAAKSIYAHQLEQKMANLERELAAHKAALEKARSALGFVGITTSNANAIVWHMNEGKDNGGLHKTALANFIQDMAKRMSEALTTINELNKP